MNTQTKNYEVVNELEYDDSTESAAVSIKVGNVVGEVVFSMTYDDNLRTRMAQSLQHVIDAGMELDFTPLEEEYQALYEDHQQRIKKERRRAAEEKWEESWVHDVEKPDTKGVEFKIQPKEEFVEQVANGRSFRRMKHPRFTVCYRDHEVTINQEDVGRDYRTSIKYQVYGSLTDHKRRNYASPENAANKIVELIDEKIERQRAKENRKQKEQRKRAEKKARLEEQFGDLGEIQVEKKYRSRSSSYYHKFYLVKGDEKLALDEHYREEGKYDFESFRELTADQVRDIIAVLRR